LPRSRCSTSRCSGRWSASRSRIPGPAFAPKRLRAPCRTHLPKATPTRTAGTDMQGAIKQRVHQQEANQQEANQRGTHSQGANLRSASQEERSSRRTVPLETDRTNTSAGPFQRSRTRQAGPGSPAPRDTARHITPDATCHAMRDAAPPPRRPTTIRHVATLRTPTYFVPWIDATLCIWPLSLPASRWVHRGRGIGRRAPGDPRQMGPFQPSQICEP